MEASGKVAVSALEDDVRGGGRGGGRRASSGSVLYLARLGVDRPPRPTVSEFGGWWRGLRCPWDLPKQDAKYWP